MAVFPIGEIEKAGYGRSGMAERAGTASRVLRAVLSLVVDTAIAAREQGLPQPDRSD